MANTVAEALIGQDGQVPLPRPDPRLVAPQWWAPQAQQLWANMRGSNFNDHESAAKLMEYLQRFATPEPDQQMPGQPINIMPPGVR